MVTLEWRLERSGGVTLVGLVVGADRPCRVRVENRLDGPVWPPRRHGEPVAGWEDGTFTGQVPGGGTIPVGYATPAPVEEPPAAVVDTEPATDAETTIGSRERALAPEVESTPAGVVRALGDPVVPRDGVPVPEGHASSKQASEADTSEGGFTEAPEPGRQADDQSPGREGSPGGRDWIQAGSATGHPVVPGAVRVWLRDVEGRLDANATGCADGDATDRSRISGRRGRQAALASAREADRSALRQVRKRVSALLARAEVDGECGARGGVSAGETADGAGNGER